MADWFPSILVPLVLFFGMAVFMAVPMTSQALGNIEGNTDK